MIVRSYEASKIDIFKYNFYLIYGKNEGLQKNIINECFLKNSKTQVILYEESEFISKSEVITEEMLSQSLFGSEKVIIVSRVSGKILDKIQEITNRNIGNTKVILKSSSLDKKSKIRNFFEKEKELIIIPVYEDKKRDLFEIVNKFLTENKIKTSREAINLLIDRASGDRENLNTELDKILNYSVTNKLIDIKTIEKLTNLATNYEVNELVENYLSKNTKNVSKILNENNYSNEDCMLILRTILVKSKRLLNIIEKNNIIKNIDEVISSTRPPIFWKEKENVKLQVNNWKIEDLKKKIYQINEVETLIKKNSQNSLNLISDFIINY